MRKHTYSDMKKGLLQETYLYFKFISTVFAAPIAYVAYRLNISANQVTIIGILLGLPAAFFNLQGSYITAIVIFHLFFLCDAADGVLARGTETKSALGGYLDDLAHYTFHTLFFVSFAIRSFQDGNQTLAFFTGLFLIMNVLMRAHMDLVTVVKLKNKLSMPSNRKGVETFSDTIRGIVLGSFEFPNVLVWMTALIWNMRYLQFYFIYAAVMSVLYFIYIVIKTIRAGFSNV